MKAADAHALIGQVLAGKYQVERLLGQGGMGDVYLVRHLQLDEPRAVKRMRPQAMSNPDAFERFRREARQQSRIRHPNVAVLYDFEEPEDGGCFLVMEYVDGQTLAAIMEPSDQVPLARAVSLLAQTAAALDASHEEGIVHRDLKPENILVGRGRDGSDRVKVVDFGVASLIENDALRLTRTGYLVGTPRYMSPEQLIPASNAPVDGRSDIYSLGLIAVELLTGTPAFECRTMADVMRRALQPPPRISTLAPERHLPPAVDEVFSYVLATERDARFAKATAFTNALVGVLLQSGHLAAAPSIEGATPWGGAPVLRATPSLSAPAMGTPQASIAPSEGGRTTRSRLLWVGVVVGMAAAAALWRVTQDRRSTLAPSINEIRYATADTTKTNADAVSQALRPPAAAEPVGSAAKPPASPRSAAARPARDAMPAGAGVNDRLQALERADAPATASDALQRMKAVSAILPELRTRRDTLAAELLVIESLAVLSETAALCARLTRIEPMAKGTTFEPSVSFWRAEIECRDPTE